jgi:hypothetical protein
VAGRVEALGEAAPVVPLRRGGGHTRGSTLLPAPLPKPLPTPLAVAVGSAAATGASGVVRMAAALVVVGALTLSSVVVTGAGPAGAAGIASTPAPAGGEPTMEGPADQSGDEPGEEPAPSPLESLRPLIRGAVDELDTVAATAAALAAERAGLEALATERRATVIEVGGTRRATALERLRRAEVSVERARGRRDATAAQAERLTIQAQRVAMGLYLEGEPILAEGLLPGRNPLSAVVAHETVRAGVKAATDAYRTVQSRLALLESSLARRVDGLRRAEAALADIDAEVAALEAEAAEADAAIVEIDRWAPLVNLAALDAQNRVVGLLELGGSPAHRAAEPTLSILGPSRLSAGQLAAWLASPGGGGVEPGRAAELATAYVEEGAAVGVRGDVAVAQAVLETAGFRFTGSNNFAGIGHCDSCPRGFAYPTLREGVRAQVQLLRAYADPDLDPATLPGGPVAGLSLDALSVKGCCESWWGLTGVWATALHYGGSILRLYESAVAHASSSAPPPD